MADDAMMYPLKVTLNGIKPPIWRRFLEWLDGKFDPEAFDASAINGMLARMKRRGLAKRSGT